VCRGLTYLHRLNVVHGDITPVRSQGNEPTRTLTLANPQNNVLITLDGQACLGDFGIAGALQDLAPDVYHLNTLRYIAPECLGTSILNRHPNKRSKESDIYSLAMTSFSVRSPDVKQLLDTTSHV